jgi:hypothetical protein
MLNGTLRPHRTSSTSGSSPGGTLGVPHRQRLEADKYTVRIVRGTAHFSAEIPPALRAKTFGGTSSERVTAPAASVPRLLPDA